MRYIFEQGNYVVPTSFKVRCSSIKKIYMRFITRNNNSIITIFPLFQLNYWYRGTFKNNLIFFLPYAIQKLKILKMFECPYF